MKSQPNGRQDQDRLLAVTDLLTNKTSLMDVECNYRYYFMCQFDKPVKFRVLGHEKKCGLDLNFDMHFNKTRFVEAGGVYGFKGYKVSNL